MGGRAFSNLRRIKREELNSTFEYVANVLSFHGLTYEYLKKNVMGSVGKQDDSGDLDFAIDMDIFSFNSYKNLAARCREVFGETNVKSSLKARQINIAVPICGDSQNGFVQTDFIYGNAEWLKFTHYSPGKDVSPFKGVFISQTFGVLAKCTVFFKYPADSFDESRLAEVSYAYNLEKGLYLRCRLRNSGGLKAVSEDTFETKCPVIPPRIPRFGYITNVPKVLSVLIAPGVKQKDVATFESLLEVLKQKRFTNETSWNEFAERLTESLKRSAAKREDVNYSHLLKWKY